MTYLALDALIVGMTCHDEVVGTNTGAVAATNMRLQIVSAVHAEAWIVGLTATPCVRASLALAGTTVRPSDATTVVTA